MRLVLVILLLLAFPGKTYSEGIESESYYSDENTQEDQARGPARGPADAVVIVRGPARNGSSSLAPTSTAAAVPSSPPTPETKDEEDDLLHFFDKKGKKIPAVPYRTGPVKNAVTVGRKLV